MSDTKLETKKLTSQPEFDSPELKQNNQVEGDILICVRRDKVWTIPIGGKNDSLDT